MSGCSVFSRIWTCTKYTQSLKYVPTHQRWFYSFHIKGIRAVANRSCRAVSSKNYTDNVRESLNHLRCTPRYFSDKADDKTEAAKTDDKTEAAKESSPGLLRRFHQTYKEHGKILVCVHLVTSAVWAGVFYCAVVRYMF